MKGDKSVGTMSAAIGISEMSLCNEVEVSTAKNGGKVSGLALKKMVHAAVGIVVGLKSIKV